MYVKYKSAYKIRLVVLNCRLFPESICGGGHYPRFEVLMGRIPSATVFD